MITVISPRQEGGVRDYSQLIAEGIGGSLAFFENGECTATSAQAEDVVLIQFSGYGYQSRGVPFSLLQWAKKKKKQGVRLGVFFHELFAFGWPWNSSFWLSPAQRYIAADLGRVADFWLTNRRALAEWLLKHSGHKPHAILPTPSNVGELQQCADPRERSLIIFGGPQVRTETYEKAGDGLFNWTRSNNIQVHDIGPPLCNEKL
jgi:hypothetical protein